MYNQKANVVVLHWQLQQIVEIILLREIGASNVTKFGVGVTRSRGTVCPSPGASLLVTWFVVTCSSSVVAQLQGGQ